jgi:F-box interacting protein
MLNWLACEDYAMKNQSFIASFDMGNESYQVVLLPEYDAVDSHTLQLSFFRNCLCLVAGNDVWIMKEYENKESWIKLFTIYMPSYSFTKVIHIF